MKHLIFIFIFRRFKHRLRSNFECKNKENKRRALTPSSLPFPTSGVKRRRRKHRIRLRSGDGEGAAAAVVVAAAAAPAHGGAASGAGPRLLPRRPLHPVLILHRSE